MRWNSVWRCQLTVTTDRVVIRTPSGKLRVSLIINDRVGKFIFGYPLRVYGNASVGTANRLSDRYEHDLVDVPSMRAYLRAYHTASHGGLLPPRGV